MKKLLLLTLALALCLLSACGQERDIYAQTPNPIATITLSDGQVMRFELDFQAAPNTVANFCQLANSGYYNGLEFFRIIPGVLIQTGDKIGDGTGNAGHAIQGEFSENGIENPLSHTRGTISMSRTADYNSASSQFFIMQGSYPEYDGKYAAFGRAMDDATLAAIDSVASVMVDGNYRALTTVPSIETVVVNTHGYTLEAATMDLPDMEEQE